jgi:hypothetical protein
MWSNIELVLCEWRRIKAVWLYGLAAGNHSTRSSPVRPIDRPVAGEADKITHAARVGDQAAELSISNLFPLDGADRLLDAFGRKP